MLRNAIPRKVNLAARSLAADVLSLLPARLKEKLPARQRLVIACIDEGLCLHVARGDTFELLWSQDRGWVDRSTADNLAVLARDCFIDMTIPQSRILEQTITLPRMAGENLDEAVSFGLSTWTPFTVDEVYFAACPIVVDGDQIKVSIKYALQSHIRPLIEAASREILPPDRLVFGEDERWSVFLSLEKKHRIAWQKRLDAGLLSAAFALVFILVLALGWRQEKELAFYRNALRQETSLLAKDTEMRKAFDATAMRRSLVARTREEHYSMSEVIAALGRRLPPETSALALEINAGKGRIEIANADSASLREALLDVEPVTAVALGENVPGQPVGVTFTVAKVTP